jgi:hypothetical protein
LVSRILFFNWLNFPLIHVIDYNDFFFYKINSNLSYLLFCRLFRIFFKLSWHFLDTYFTNMIVIIEWVLCCVYFLFFSFNKCNTLRNQTIISIDIQLDSFFSNFLYSFNKTIRISVWIVIYYSHSSIYLSHLFPMWHFTWTIILNIFEFIRITILSLKFITSMFEKISYLTNFYLFIILYNKFIKLLHKEYIS